VATPSEKPKRRIVKKVETTREKAEKNRVLTDKPKKFRALRLAGRYIAKPFKVVFRPFKKLGKYKVFRILGLILLPRYFRNSWKELKQVTWPNRRESWQLTSAVIIFSIIFGALVALVDFGLDKVFKEVLLK
jgi:preprotein translocase SecE subunit